MSEFTFTGPNGSTFTLKAPAGVTLAQAQAIFKQQSDTGALVGFKVGDALSAATQAADGLTSALPQLSQGLAAATKLLPPGINASSITSALGTSGAAVAGQIGSALQGTGAAISSTIATGATSLSGLASGVTSQINSLGSFQTALSGATSGITSQFSALSGALTGQAAQVGSIANDAIKTLTSTISGTPLNGINISNFAKQIPSLGSIGNLSQVDVTGTLAQASKMIGQGFDKVSNQLGAGKFGFDASQLEKAGMVKPGTAAAFLQAGNNDLVEVLKSPTVWTGKDGIKGLDGLLKNAGAQDKIQQGLMSSGLKDLKQMGIPVDKLNPAALSGLATNAAKSVDGAMAWATNAANLPQIPTVPGGDVKSAFNNMATNGAFAVKFGNEKVEPPLKQEEPVVPASNTVNTETVSAAAERVVGNDKVPSVSADGAVSNATTLIQAKLTFSDQIFAGFAALEPTTTAYEKASGITQSQWETLNAELTVIRATFNARAQSLSTAAFEAVEALPSGSTKDRLVSALNKSNNVNTALREYAKILIKRVKDLANKIVTSGSQTT
jgi:hypothetical protein